METKINDIQIEYINATGHNDFQVVVFTKNFSSTDADHYVAWQVITEGQTKAEFVYPKYIYIGATYESNGQTQHVQLAGVLPGSTWNITQNSPNGNPYFEQDHYTPPNPYITVVIVNLKPHTWSGQSFDLGVYKSNRLLVVQPNVKVGEEGDFTLQPKLFFGVVRNNDIEVGKIFTSFEMISDMAEFDISKFPNGTRVTLNEVPGGGKYNFTATPISQ